MSSTGCWRSPAKAATTRPTSSRTRTWSSAIACSPWSRQCLAVCSPHLWPTCQADRPRALPAPRTRPYRQFPQFTGQNEAALVGWLRRLVGQKLADLARYHNRAKRSSGGPIMPLDAPWGLEGGAGADPGHGGGRLLDMLALSQTSPSEAA